MVSTASLGARRICAPPCLGAREFREALDRYQTVLENTESRPEIKVGQALLRAGFRVVPQFELKLSSTWTVRIDLYLPEFERGVEVNPDCTHASTVPRQYDIARALRIRRVHGIEIDEVGDDEIDRGCPELIAMLRTLRSQAA